MTTHQTDIDVAEFVRQHGIRSNLPQSGWCWTLPKHVYLSMPRRLRPALRRLEPTWCENTEYPFVIIHGLE